MGDYRFRNLSGLEILFSTCFAIVFFIITSLIFGGILGKWFGMIYISLLPFIFLIERKLRKRSRITIKKLDKKYKRKKMIQFLSILLFLYLLGIVLNYYAK